MTEENQILQLCMEDSLDHSSEMGADEAPGDNAYKRFGETPPATLLSHTSLRVNVDLLDMLMNLAGELVLSRNQLLQGLNASHEKTVELSGQRIDMITSELQEAIMRTRMQPIGGILNRFSRIVRDLGLELEKTIDLALEGKNVELDKTILEGIHDPLIHLVRNAAVHGIELPAERERAGKDSTGKIRVSAFHEAGQVNLVISDDGRGLNPVQIAARAYKNGLISKQQTKKMPEKQVINLIFKPGFSAGDTGQGMGLDVVTTNIEGLGGVVEVESVPGQWTTFRIKLPLTLAIIPSQIVSVGDERYAIPQVGLDELLRIPAADIRHRVEMVGDAPVFRLRGKLLPLLNLSQILGIEKTFVHPEDGKEHADRRMSIADRRCTRHIVPEKDPVSDPPGNRRDVLDRGAEDRRYHAQSTLIIAVVSTGTFKYGLVVDRLFDSEEIVVKPLGRDLKKCRAYAGATIMGDGKVAMILDIASLAQIGGLHDIARASQASADRVTAETEADREALLTFRNADTEYAAVPLVAVARIERFRTADIERIGRQKVVQYRGGSLPLYELSQAAGFRPLPAKELQEVIVFKIKNREVGLMVTPPVDAVEVPLEVDTDTLKQLGVTGSLIIDGRTTLLVDIHDIVRHLNPEWFGTESKKTDSREPDREKTILLAEDSAFFRRQVAAFMEEDGYRVLTAPDGLVAWELLKENRDRIDLVVTDIDMPDMDGFELTRLIKNDPHYAGLDVIALTSLASEAHIRKGKKAGIDAYEIKLDRERLMKLLRRRLSPASDDNRPDR